MSQWQDSQTEKVWDVKESKEDVEQPATTAWVSAQTAAMAQISENFPWHGMLMWGGVNTTLHSTFLTKKYEDAPLEFGNTATWMQE